MTEVELIWRAKSDDELLVAAAELDTYEDEGQRAIRDELRRRGFEDPVEQSRSNQPVELIWRARSDDELLAAAAELDTYEDEAQRVIRDELWRRGLEDPVEQSRFIVPEPGAIRPVAAEAPPAQNPFCVRCEVAQRYLGARWFRQGADAGTPAEHKPTFEIDQSFDVYVCPRCGHVDLFVGGSAE